MNLALYRNAIILAGVAVASAGAAWTAQGWRKDKAMAVQMSSHKAADAARADARTVAWGRVAESLTAQLVDAHAKLASQRVANSAQLRRIQAEQAAMSAEYACRLKPLPEQYLESYRGQAKAE